MPRTGGVYTPPAGTKGVSNTPILSVPYNAFIDDLTADANAARPVTAGGTGANSASGARTNLGVPTGTSGHVLPFIDVTNTWSANQIFENGNPAVILNDTSVTNLSHRIDSFGDSLTYACDVNGVKSDAIHRWRFGTDTVMFIDKAGGLTLSGGAPALTVGTFMGYHRGNAKGTVSQSGGTPTGAIVERGSNANGDYARFADGTQICTRVSALDLTAGTGYYSYAYPATFSDTPCCGWSAANTAPGANITALRSSFLGSTGSTWEFNLGGVGSSGVNLRFLAIGRWY